ncbi:choline ABC transporter substrate-binding protein [Fodinicurvata sp. EGI_FJ10296]|uniref:choline ABC transporter substrate-binding protein n=1 Tax=Fodinicurvata sp. EGI_FJ10296 TaxID=3231908 RepID=UPI0034568DA6
MLRNTATRACLLAGAATVVMAAAVGSANAEGDPESCESVEIANVGWTDITATTGVAEVLLAGLGYQPEVTVASVPITFEGLARGDIDFFLGLWMPTMDGMIEQHLEAERIEQMGANLEGAKYTLAVTQGAYEAGLTSFGDIADHADLVGEQIFGIEPGNDGNLLIEGMIAEDAFGLSDFTLVESSEQGMLIEVQRRADRGEESVFLGWEPHPMNRTLDMEYLTGGEDWFGPDLGGATIYTLARTGLADDCPNIYRLLENLQFTLEMENELMAYILDDGMEGDEAAELMLTNDASPLEGWLDGVTTIDGGDGEAAVRDHLGL